MKEDAKNEGRNTKAKRIRKRKKKEMKEKKDKEEKKKMKEREEEEEKRVHKRIRDIRIQLQPPAFSSCLLYTLANVLIRYLNYTVPGGKCSTNNSIKL